MNHLAVLARARAAAESRFTETIRAGRFTMVTNPTTGNAERTLTTTRYEGPAQFKDPSAVVSDTDAGGQVVAEQSRICKVPASAPLLYEGDEIEVTASDADDALVNRVYVVKGMPEGGQTSSHRYPVKELS